MPSGPTRKEWGGGLSAFQPFREPSRLVWESIGAQPSVMETARDAETSTRLRHQDGIAFNHVAFKLSILMAAYNEESTVTQAIYEILGASYPFDIELIVVDDGSTDKTEALLSQLDLDRLVVHRHSVNRGKGAALRTAASLATGTHILPFDADLEYVPEDIPRVLEPVLRGRCNVVYGVRLFGCNTVYRSYRYALGNRVLTGLANILFNAHLTDLHTCLKLIPLPMLRDLSLSESGFGLDTELTALLLRSGIRPFEVPVTYYGRSHEQGKKITWRDAFDCAWILLRVRIRRNRRSHRASSVSPSSSGQVREQAEHHNGSHVAPASWQVRVPLPISQTKAPEIRPDRKTGYPIISSNLP
jgi:dolichol-phosphate hexosyltransferase